MNKCLCGATEGQAHDALCPHPCYGKGKDEQWAWYTAFNALVREDPDCNPPTPEGTSDGFVWSD